MYGYLGKTGCWLLSLFLMLSMGFLGWVQGGPNDSESGSPLVLRDLVHPSNLTIVSQKRTPFNDTDYKGVKPLGRNDTVVGRSNQTRAVIPDDGRLRCYVCSWSIYGRAGNNSENMLDTCSSHHSHFNPERTHTIPCDHGCETKAFRKSEKDDIRQYFRNCFQPEEGKELRDRCYTTKSTIYGIEETCECLTHLCNESPPSTRSLAQSVLLFLMGIRMLLLNSS